MALAPVCGVVKKGQDLSCVAPNSRFVQQMVIINRSDLAGQPVINTETIGDDCKHSVTFKLKDGKEGVRFTFSENGTVVSGTYAKSNNDQGYPQFLHTVNMAVAGSDESTKCTLESLTRGRFIVALQIGTVIEVYGVQNGLTAGDFTADPQVNSGFIPFPLVSSDANQEPHVPLNYKSEVAGQEEEDFDANFKAG